MHAVATRRGIFLDNRGLKATAKRIGPLRGQDTFGAFESAKELMVERKKSSPPCLGGQLVFITGLAPTKKSCLISQAAFLFPN
jgi:hypothetical protein